MVILENVCSSLPCGKPSRTREGDQAPRVFRPSRLSPESWFKTLFGFGWIHGKRPPRRFQNIRLGTTTGGNRARPRLAWGGGKMGGRMTVAAMTMARLQAGLRA